MKNILAAAFLLVLSFESTASETHECTWLKSEKHRQGFFQKGSKFIFTANSSAFSLSKNSNFLDRYYEKCPSRPTGSCAFYFGHDVNTDWDIDFSEVDNKYLVSQIYGYGFQAWFEIDFNKDSSKAAIIGDDGDGVYFEEEFSCKKM